ASSVAPVTVKQPTTNHIAATRNREQARVVFGLLSAVASLSDPQANSAVSPAEGQSATCRLRASRTWQLLPASRIQSLLQTRERFSTWAKPRPTSVTWSTG